MSRTVWVVLLLVLVLAIGLLAGRYLGRQAAYTEQETNPASSYSLQQGLTQSRGELAAARDELEMRRTRHEVDRQALEMLRRDMAVQNEQLAKLEEGLRFYRSLMAPDTIATGLSVREPELVAGRRAGHFALRIVIQQKASKHQTVKGELAVEVSGTQGEEAVTYSLQELAQNLPEGALSLGFKYFQVFEAQLVVPESFEPGSITVEVQASKPRATELRQLFSWHVQERFTDVGK